MTPNLLAGGPNLSDHWSNQVRRPCWAQAFATSFWPTAQDTWKSPKRCVLALDFRYPDFFSEFYPDSGGYLEIFDPYPDYDIYSKKSFFLTFL